MAASDLTKEEMKQIKQGNEKCRQWLKENIGWKEEAWPEIPKVEKSDSEVLVEAFPIMGIEKYMGNADKAERIAYFPQIKMAHNATRAVTWLKFDKSLKENVFIVDGKLIEDPKGLKGMDVMLQRLQQWTGIKTHFAFASANIARVKAQGKGLGTSAAAGGAAAMAFTEALMPELKKNNRFLSTFARYFSGSGTSSACGGWSIWLSHKGINPMESYGVRFDKGESNIRVVAVPIPSKVKTEDAHGSGEASEFYADWARHKGEKCIKLMEAVKADGIGAIGRIAELDSINLFHILVSGKGFFNWEPETLDLLRKVNLMRKEEGLTCYASMDTGPSLAIITTRKESGQVKGIIEEYVNGLGHAEDWPVHSVEKAGPPRLLPLKQKEDVLTAEAKRILKGKGITV
ncbi:MAG: hypothetical protein JW744_01385 [Candidatus Diapherotrites archaeon]|uniref:Diphosphomevalonate decarboxylase-like N-terminal domain-containing protein n=1 Tax=Candidatus Iainarchaeum sp. TaxID=3101447 RepID=A0A939C6Y7_9ARCH|nr:hypothetical protein [Candidatus Diapherotrites archaeon]